MEEGEEGEDCGVGDGEFKEVRKGISVEGASEEWVGEIVKVFEE